MTITVGLLSYAWFEDPNKLEFRWGLLVTFILFLLIGAPLFNFVSILLFSYQITTLIEHQFCLSTS